MAQVSKEHLHCSPCPSPWAAKGPASPSWSLKGVGGGRKGKKEGEEKGGEPGGAGGFWGLTSSRRSQWAACRRLLRSAAQKHGLPEAIDSGEVSGVFPGLYWSQGPLPWAEVCR